MFSRTWNITGLYKHSKERQRSGRQRARRSGNTAGGEVLLVQREPSDRAGRIPSTTWQCLLQAARSKRDVLVMLGRDRDTARKEAIDDMAEARLRALSRIDFSS